MLSFEESRVSGAPCDQGSHPASGDVRGPISQSWGPISKICQPPTEICVPSPGRTHYSVTAPPNPESIKPKGGPNGPFSDFEAP